MNFLIRITSILKNESSIIIIGYFFLQLFLDFFQKINDIYNIELIHFHRYLKLSFFIYVTIHLILRRRSITNKFLLIFFGFIVIFLISQNFTSERIEYFIQFEFFMIVLLLLNLQDINIDYKKFYQWFKIFMYLNFCCIILGLLFNIEIFRTYAFRFGYNGLLITSMQSTIMCFSALILAVLHRDRRFIVLILISSVLIGTKSLMLGMPLFFLLFYTHNRQFISIKYLIFISVSFISLFCIVLLTPTFNEIISEKGIVTAFFSFRNVLLNDAIDVVSQNMSVHNILFGGFDLSLVKTEFDFIDIFLFFGIIGVLLFILLLKLLFIKHCENHLYKIYFYIIIIISLFSGNVFLYPVNSFLFLITLNAIISLSKEKHYATQN